MYEVVSMLVFVFMFLLFKSDTPKNLYFKYFFFGMFVWSVFQVAQV